MDDVTTFDDAGAAFAAALASDPAQTAFSVIALNVALGMMAGRIAYLEHDRNEYACGRGGKPEPMSREDAAARSQQVAEQYITEGRTVAVGNLVAGGILVPVEDSPK